MTTKGQKTIIVKALFYALILGVIYLSFKLFFGPLLPFLLAGALVLSLQPLVNLLHRKFKIKRNPVSVALVLIVYIIVIGITIWLARLLYIQLTDFLTSLPAYFDTVSAQINAITNRIGSIMGKMPDVGNGWLKDMPTTALKSAVEKLGVGATEIATNFAAGIPSFLLSMAVMIIASVYIAKDYSTFTEYMNSIIPEKIIEKFNYIKDNVLRRIAKLLKGYLLILIITFFELVLGLSVLKVKYALIIALATALIDILPVVGLGAVLIPWAVFSALSGNPERAIGLAVLYILIATIRNVIDPKIIGDKLGIHPVFSLAITFLGLKLFGAVGVLLAPLITIAVKTLLEIKYGQKETAKEETS